jgi:hypothetical protein
MPRSSLHPWFNNHNDIIIVLSSSTYNFYFLSSDIFLIALLKIISTFTASRNQTDDFQLQLLLNSWNTSTQTYTCSAITYVIFTILQQDSTFILHKFLTLKEFEHITEIKPVHRNSLCHTCAGSRRCSDSLGPSPPEKLTTTGQRTRAHPNGYWPKQRTASGGRERACV